MGNTQTLYGGTISSGPVRTTNEKNQELHETTPEMATKQTSRNKDKVNEEHAEDGTFRGHQTDGGVNDKTLMGMDSTALVTASTRSCAPPNKVVAQELGIVTSHAMADSFSTSSVQEEMQVQEALKRKVVQRACEECSFLGGNAVLAMQLQVIGESNGGYRTKAHATGTCVRLQEERSKKWGRK